MKKALISGITGQDGAYLAANLLAKGYEVHGIKRRSSSFNTQRVDHIYVDPHAEKAKFFLHYGDITDGTNILRIIQETQPDEIYNLAAQSHVAVSFETPEYTGNSDGLGALRFLEAIRIMGLTKKTKFYQASTSELYGNSPSPQNENTPFAPRSPYAAAKLYAYWICVNYREAYGIHASNGILFNHESPLRGETFVTRKITRAAANIKLGVQNELFMGNLNAKRDWGHAKEYVEGMWAILQQSKPDDYVLATGRTTTVRDFIHLAFSNVGISLDFKGEGLNEVGTCQKTGRVLVKIDPGYFRPTEVHLLCGDASKAKADLNWEAKITVEQICKEMVAADLYRSTRQLNLKKENVLSAEAMAFENESFSKWFEVNHYNDG